MLSRNAIIGLVVILSSVVLLVVLLVVKKRKDNENKDTANFDSSLAITSIVPSPDQIPFASRTIHGVATKTAGFRPIRLVPMAWRMPIQFDARIKFGKMLIPNSEGIEGCISPPPNQGNCGASWAFAVAGMISDRIRIQSSVPMVTQMALAKQNLDVNWLMKEGNQCLQLRSLIKGNYDFPCDPFAICQLGTPVLALQFTQNRGCVAENAAGSGNNRAIDLYKIKEFYTVSLDIAGEMNYYFFPGQRRMRPETQWVYHEGVINIQKEIIDRGPVVVVFNLYSDLLQQYRRGLKNDDVYIQPEGSKPIVDYVTRHGVKYLGDQAACIVGWGEKYYYSEKIEYWVLRMTWGDDWNGDGYFKIQRGVNCCNLELETLGSWGYAIESTRRGSYVDESDVDKVPQLLTQGPVPWAIVE